MPNKQKLVQLFNQAFTKIHKVKHYFLFIETNKEMGIGLSPFYCVYDGYTLNAW